MRRCWEGSHDALGERHSMDVRVDPGSLWPRNLQQSQPTR
jgi:hypothetical protein